MPCDLNKLLKESQNMFKIHKNLQKSPKLFFLKLKLSKCSLKSYHPSTNFPSFLLLFHLLSFLSATKQQQQKHEVEKSNNFMNIKEDVER